MSKLCIIKYGYKKLLPLTTVQTAPHEVAITNIGPEETERIDTIKKVIDKYDMILLQPMGWESIDNYKDFLDNYDSNIGFWYSNYLFGNKKFFMSSYKAIEFDVNIASYQNPICLNSKAITIADSVHDIVKGIMKKYICLNTLGFSFSFGSYE